MKELKIIEVSRQGLIFKVRCPTVEPIWFDLSENGPLTAVAVLALCISLISVSGHSKRDREQLTSFLRCINFL